MKYYYIRISDREGIVVRDVTGKRDIDDSIRVFAGRRINASKLNKLITNGLDDYVIPNRVCYCDASHLNECIDSMRLYLSEWVSNSKKRRAEMESKEIIYSAIINSNRQTEVDANGKPQSITQKQVI